MIATPQNERDTPEDPKDEGRKLTPTEAMERALAESASKEYVLKLYVTGMTERSSAAIRSIRQMCEENLSGRYQLEVIDITRHPALAADEQIIAVPTLIKKLPGPIRRLVGSLADRDRVLFGLDLRPR